MLARLRAAAQAFKRELRVYRLLLKDDRTPRPAKLLLGLAVGYAFLPFDLIPDFIPGIGHVDDLIVIPSLVLLALKMVPKELVEEHRESVRISNVGSGSAPDKKLSHPPRSAR